MKKITILIPAYNEGGNIDTMYHALVDLMDNPQNQKYDWEILFVNDGSKDDTLTQLRQLREQDKRVCYVNLSRNFGKENALLAGMDYSTGDAVVIIDADLQHPVSVIPQMIYWWEQGYDDVYGKRQTRGQESWLRKRLSLAFYSLLQSTTRIEILQNVGDFRLLDKRVVNAIKSLRETQRYTKGLYCWVGYNKKEVLFEQTDRRAGKSSFSMGRLINLAIDGITSYSTAPLRFSALLGIVVSFASFLYLCFIFGKTLLYGDPVPGFPTLISVILLLGGLQLLVLGIIGEYIGRIFNETKQRPSYIAESYNETRL